MTMVTPWRKNPMAHEKGAEVLACWGIQVSIRAWVDFRN